MAIQRCGVPGGILTAFAVVLFCAFFPVSAEPFDDDKSTAPLRMELTSDDPKPAHLAYMTLVKVATFHTQTTDWGHDHWIREIQRNMNVPKSKAEELLAYFQKVSEKMQAEELETALRLLCPTDGTRPTGERIGIVHNAVDDLHDVRSRKHLVMAQVELSQEVFQALSKWLEEFSFSYHRLDHTKMGGDRDLQLTMLCYQLEARQYN